MEDQAALEEFVTTLVEAYPMPGADRTVLRNPALLDAAVRLFVGYVDDRPVGTSGARLGHGLVDVEWVSARAEVRGRGSARR